MKNFLSTDLELPTSIPYFLWDEQMTVAELRLRLAGSPPNSDDRIRLLAKVLREARDTDVWKFTTPQEVFLYWQKLLPYLGRRRGFWKSLIEFWEKEGLIGKKHP